MGTECTCKGTSRFTRARVCYLYGPRNGNLLPIAQRSVYNLLPESMTRALPTHVLSTLFVLSVLAFAPTTAQVTFEENRTAKQILDSYDSFERAVLHMTRDEWEVVRAWEGFDEERYLTFLHEYHDSFDAERASNKELRLQKIMEDDACGCWIEPDDSYTTMVPPPGLGGLGPNEMAWANQGGAGWNVDCASEPIPVSASGAWTFDLYGATYGNFYVNSKGQISFGGDVIDWTPTGFPAAEYNQIAGYWQDTDIRSVGEIKWKRTADAVYVNYIDVGYYNNQDNLTNSFQIIITYPESGVLPQGSNAQVCYLDMNWSHGDVNGSGGCCGTDPGVTGADGEDTSPNVNSSPHVQFGRFNLPDDTYNGPYGIGDDEQDGINWLDFKFFNINTAESTNNLNPVATENLGCDTITLCLGQSTSLDVAFLGPEPGQTVNVTVEESLTGASSIDGLGSTNGETATVTGTFNAASAGLNTVTITATDSDGATTQLDIVINVLGINPPSIEVASPTGEEFGICAGAELAVVANSIGGDEPVSDWSWNLNSSYWDENEATIPFGGTFVVTGETAGGCVVRESFEVIQTPYYLPTVEGTLQAVCPGDSVFVEVIPDDDENFVSYEWVPNWNNGGGEVLEDLGSGAWLSAGIYQVVVADEGGCEGRRTFLLSQTAASIPEELNVTALCGDEAFDPVEFTGGFASPSEGFLSFQLSGSTGNGWGGSYLDVQIIHEDGTVTTSTVSLASGTFANINDDPDLAIVYGDSIQVTYISADPSNDEFNTFDMFNCVQNCIGDNANSCTTFDDLSSGLLFYGPALCQVQPALGAWEETSNLGNNTFASLDTFNTVWSATEFGLYELCFTENECGIESCYEVEVSDVPAIELSEGDEVWVCGDDILDLTAFVTDPGGAASINWPYPGNDDVTQNDYTWTQYSTPTLVVTVTNGCGEATDQVAVTAVPEPLLEDAFICEEGTFIELDPITGDQNTDFVYNWSYNGNDQPDVQDNEWEVGASGVYCVTTPFEECPPSFDDSDCGFVDIVSQLDPDLVFDGGATTDCDGGGIEPGADAVLGVSEAFMLQYPDYTITWPDGTETTADPVHEWIIPEESELNNTTICVEVADPYGCDPQEVCGLVFIGDVPTWDPQPTYSGALSLCPEQPETLDLNANFTVDGYADYTWSVTCATPEGEDTLVTFEWENVVDVLGEMFPQTCWGYTLDLTASIANPCLASGLQHDYSVVVDNCEILPVNVFTPRDGNDKNNAFIIMGLEPWEDDEEGVLVRIFNRWGNLVYENPRYRNGSPWYGDDAADGVYFYTILLPNGDEKTGTVNIFRFR